LPSPGPIRIDALPKTDTLYDRVDDYGWYQGQFESHITQLYPRMGLQFLKELHRRFPASGAVHESPSPTPMTPEQVLEELETFAPGFVTWAKVFQK